MASTATQLSWGQVSAGNYTGRGKPRRKAKETAHRNQPLAPVGNGDTVAFEQLYQQSAPRVLKTLYRITRNHEDAEDALQDAFMSAFVHRRTAPILGYVMWSSS